MRTELVSIIVPVYNVEDYINECLDSVTNQTYTNLEIIVVDDGSTDTSGDLCDTYAKNDTRIKVIHKENGGLSDARNAGIETAKGEYIFFIDSDDSMDLDTIQILYKELKNNECDVAICTYQNFRKKFEIKKYESTFSEVVNFEECMNRYFNTEKYKASIVVAWGKLYKAELWKELRFPYGKLHEDEFTTYKVLFEAKKIVYVDAELCYYRSNPLSITGEKCNVRHLDVLQAFEECISFLEANGYYEFADKYRKQYLMQGLKGYDSMYELLSEDRKKELEHNLRKIIYCCKKTKYIDKKEKMKFFRWYYSLRLKKLLK